VGITGAAIILSGARLDCAFASLQSIKLLLFPNFVLLFVLQLTKVVILGCSLPSCPLSRWYRGRGVLRCYYLTSYCFEITQALFALVGFFRGSSGIGLGVVVGKGIARFVVAGVLGAIRSWWYTIGVDGIGFDIGAGVSS
jgi:hypothetical protein